jgi:hypothetical protein
MGRRRHPTRRLAGGPQAKGFSKFKINSEINFSREKIARKGIKIHKTS